VFCLFSNLGNTQRKTKICFVVAYGVKTSNQHIALIPSSPSSLCLLFDQLFITSGFFFFPFISTLASSIIHVVVVVVRSLWFLFISLKKKNYRDTQAIDVLFFEFLL